jgi:hypothetical protein
VGQTLTADTAGVKHYLMKPALSGGELLHCRFTRCKNACNSKCGNASV